jgi:hypothetical protein
MEFVDFSVFVKNLPPKSSNARTLKYWQRLIACLAADEVYERKKTNNNMKFEYCRLAYERHAENVLQKFQNLIPQGFTVEYLCRACFSNSKEFTGEQIWNLWEDTNREITNVFLIEWLVLTKGGKIPSGKQVDDVVLEFRKLLFDLKKRKTADVIIDLDCSSNLLVEPKINLQTTIIESKNGIISTNKKSNNNNNNNNNNNTVTITTSNNSRLVAPANLFQYKNTGDNNNNNKDDDDDR